MIRRSYVPRGVSWRIDRAWESRRRGPVVGVHATVTRVSPSGFHCYVKVAGEIGERRARVLSPGSIVIGDRVFGRRVDADGFTVLSVARHTEHSHA